MSAHFEDTKRGRGRVKHAILKYYLGGYFGATGQTPEYDRIVYIDGFAGAGEYTPDEGPTEDGSPIIAYKRAVEHRYYHNFCDIHMIFIEADPKKAESLNRKLVVVKENYPGKDKVTFEVKCGLFDREMEQILEVEDYSNDPMLIFADPFGIKGVPMTLMKTLVERPRTEIFINVMFSSINRWYGNQKLNQLFNELLGEENSEWKRSVFQGNLPKADQFIKYYVSKLQQNNTFQHIFAMKNQRNRNIYQLVFITHFYTAMENMKRAMHSMSQQSNAFVYSEWLEEKIAQGRDTLTMSKPEIESEVVNRIINEFNGQTVSGHRIEIFVWCKTPFIFNLKNELKRRFKDFIETDSKKFEQMVFNIPSTSIL